MASTKLNKPAPQLVLDLINASNTATNTTPLTFTDVGFDNPVAHTADAEGRNTTVRVYALPNTHYEGEVQIDYRRLGLSDVISGDLFLVRIVGMTKIADVISAINAKYMLQLGTADYVDLTLPTFTGTPGEVKVFTLTAAANSYAFVGSVSLSLKIPLISLPGILTTKSMTGLTM